MAICGHVLVNGIFPGSVFKGTIVPFSSLSAFVSDWNANLKARVPAAILDHEVTLGTAAEQSETTKQVIRDRRNVPELWTPSFQLLHGKETLVFGA